MDEKLQEKVKRLQAIEEQLNGYLGQKQQVQAKLLELESAHTALGGAGKAHRIVGNVMVERDAGELRAELEKETEALKVRVASFEKQEKRLKDEAERLQKGLMDGMKEE